MKSQDLVLLLYVSTCEEARWTLTYEALGLFTGLSTSEAHKSLRRSATAGLFLERRRQVVVPNLLEFLLHGVRYVFPAPRGPFVRGIPTGYSAPPLHGAVYMAEGAGPVWPHEAGTVRGHAISPLYPTVPEVAPRTPEFYALLALVDALREGRARERTLAARDLTERLTLSPVL